MNPLASTMAEIIFNDPTNILKKVKSLQVGLISSGQNLSTTYLTQNENFSSVEIPDPSSSLTIPANMDQIKTNKNFVIRDINIIYRGKNVK